MYRPLVPCPECHRHVRAGDALCPFCRHALPDDLAARAVPNATQRLSRAAAFVFSTTVAVTGCSGEVTGGKVAGGSDDGSSGSGGGGGSTSSGAGAAGPEDDGGAAVLYGPAPTPDAGPDDDGGNGAKYGAPPMPDGGPTSDGGGGEPLYGAPPPRD
jgi:hypothetical protein